MTRSGFGAAPAMLALCAALCAGCLSRRVAITSNPPGALVTINDVEVGRTPLEADLTYYGVYDVRVEKAGYEVLRTRANARAPFYEYPPMDLGAMMVPSGVDTVIRWHFTLEPAWERAQGSAEFESGLLDRARRLRGRIDEK